MQTLQIMTRTSIQNGTTKYSNQSQAIHFTDNILPSTHQNITRTIVYVYLTKTSYESWAAIQRQILIWRSGILQGYTLQLCTIPLDLASGSGLATAASAFLVQQGS